MDEPVRRGRKRWAVAAGLLGTLVLGFAACEGAGWPFLAGPVERALSKALVRELRLNPGDENAGHATVRFLGGLTVKVPVLQIDAPAWSKRPYFLHATHAELRLSYRDIWRARQGEPLTIDLLHADTLNVHAERLADGRASWVFGDPNKKPLAKTPADAQESSAAMAMPLVRDLRVLRGDLTYVDAPLKANIAAKLQLSEGEATEAQPIDKAARGLVASAEGTYRRARLTAQLRSARVAPLLREGADAEPVAIVLDLKAGSAALSFNGTVTDVINLANMRGTFKVSGSSLAAVGDPLGVTLPTTGAFKLNGRVVKAGEVWHVVADDATVGQSRLKAAMTYDMRPRVPLLSGEVTGSRLLLADLAPTIGGEPGAASALPPSAATPASARVIPDKEFDLPSLRVMNADVLLSFDRVELGSLFARPLEPLKTHLLLRNGVLLLDDVRAGTADGNLAGKVSLDGTDQIALWQTDLRWWGVRLERWIKQERDGEAPPYVSGALAGMAQLKGRGKSTAQILGSIDGSVATTLRQGQISHLVVEAAGLDVAQALGVMIKGDEGLPVDCALADMQAQQGVLHPRALVVETDDSAIWAEGTVSMKDEALDLRLVVAPKDFSPLSLRSPLKVKGTFSSPKVSIEKKPIVARVGASVLLSFVNPLAALIPFVDPGSRSGEGADHCANMLDRAREAGRLQKARGG